jgi:hypothetical protein
MIKEIRDYITSVLKEIDSSFDISEQPNTPEGIGASRHDKIFWLNLNSLDVEYSSNFYTDNYSLTLELASKSGRYPQESHDFLWCKAIEFRDLAMTREKLEENSFDNLQITNISPSNLSDNELWTKLTLNMTISLSNHFM